MQTTCMHTAQYQSLHKLTLDRCILRTHTRQSIKIVLSLSTLVCRRLRRVLLDVLLCKGNRWILIIISLNWLEYHRRCNSMDFGDNTLLHLCPFANLTSTHRLEVLHYLQDTSETKLLFKETAKKKQHKLKLNYYRSSDRTSFAMRFWRIFQRIIALLA